MSRLPEDLRLALEGLALLKEKFIGPLSRLDQLLRVCVDSHERIADAQQRLKAINTEIEQAQQKGVQQEERQQARLKTLQDHLTALQAKGTQEELIQQQKQAEAQQQFNQSEAACADKRRELAKITEDVQEETRHLEELRVRIRRAQTMEP